jgi:hypothetical protein
VFRLLRQRTDLQPLAPEERPGSGGGSAAAYEPVHAQRRRRPVDAGVLDVQLGRERDALLGLRLRTQRAVLDAVHRGGQQPGAREGEAREQVAAGVGLPHLLRDDAVDRTGVQALFDEEGAGARQLVARQQRVLHGGRAAPCGQQGEVQVDPAVGRHVQGDARQQRPIGDDGTAVRPDLAEPVQELLVPGPRRLEDLDPLVLRPLRDRAGHQPPSASGTGVGPCENRRHLVPLRGDQCVESGDGDLGGPGEDEPHRW